MACRLRYDFSFVIKLLEEKQWVNWKTLVLRKERRMNYLLGAWVPEAVDPHVVDSFSLSPFLSSLCPLCSIRIHLHCFSIGALHRRSSITIYVADTKLLRATMEVTFQQFW
ncbi:hypothetical protein VN97_g8373 [Penicillium thymicola]|uniref:Uncharacterized protein n=1 Tax=Penicillium thymicola TaxID=293382 RepID=A0AAI9TDH5_PENTH|nr:hypothetical protein VN97_g8373 [Penicillium thymicola]